MAKKPVKKTTTKKVAPVAAAPVAPVTCNCGCGCRGGFGRFLKKLIVFLVIFALGFVAGKLCDHAKRMHKMMPKFDNGCMVTSKIKCPEMLARVAALDVDANGCITKEEFRAGKKEFFRGKKCGGEEKREKRIIERVETVEIYE